MPRNSRASDLMAALERIRLNATILVPPGSVVSRDTVAMEAGMRPEGLQRRRYPEVVLRIEEIRANGRNMTGMATVTPDLAQCPLHSNVGARREARDAEEIALLKLERAALLAKVLSLESFILVHHSKCQKADE